MSYQPQACMFYGIVLDLDGIGFRHDSPVREIRDKFDSPSDRAEALLLAFKQSPEWKRAREFAFNTYAEKWDVCIIPILEVARMQCAVGVSLAQLTTTQFGCGYAAIAKEKFNPTDARITLAVRVIGLFGDFCKVTEPLKSIQWHLFIDQY